MQAKAIRTNVFVLLMILGFASLGFGQGSPNVPLLAHVNQYASTGYSNLWGHTAPDGREYALLGVKSGTSIVDITNTNNPVEVAFISAPLSSWREIKTYQQYAYVVTEAGGGMQIIDLSNLPTSASLASTYTGFSTAHTLWIDQSTGILYAEGDAAQPVRVLSLANPTSPVQIGFFGIECHDIYVQNNLAYVSEGNQHSVGIYDVTTPSAAVHLATVTLPAPAGYAHNAWTTADGNFLMTTEETTGKTVKMWNISNLSAITLTDEYLGPTNLAHNAHIKENFAYISHYADGLRIVDISNPSNIFEVGYYDTYPSAGSGFVGAWGTYPYFNSGKVIISDIQSGLYVVFFDDGSTPPLITSTPGTTATVGQPYSYDSDNTVNVLGTPAITFSFTGPTGFNVDANTGLVTWTPTVSQVGAHPVSITATNAFGSNMQNYSITVSAAPPSYTTRINCGGSNYTTGGGTLFVADQAYTTGSFGYINGSPKSYTNAIANTTDDPLYQKMRRRNSSNFQYDFDVPSGTYSVTLHLMSPATNWVMDVTAEGTLIYNDLDIDTDAEGIYTAKIKTFSTTVTDGRLDLTFTRVSGYAAVCGIEVVQTGAASLSKESSAPAAEIAGAPQDFQLFQNYPNPFWSGATSRSAGNPTTVISFQLPVNSEVQFAIYSITGQFVKQVASGNFASGRHQFTWDGRDQSGNAVAAGVYLYRITAVGENGEVKFTQTKRMAFVK